MVRKPGMALFGSLVAAGVEGIITQWGMSALIYGLVQGLGAELVFALFLYRKWNWSVLLLAASMAAVSLWLRFLEQEQANLSIVFNAIQLAVFVISSWVFAGRWLWETFGENRPAGWLFNRTRPQLIQTA